ncbi:MAG: dihydroorotase [Limnochordaceae bacterium]|nr:dihydroorotase [Limnochordaceae bacterium]
MARSIQAKQSPPSDRSAQKWLLRGGHVIDPANGRDAVLDILLADGVVAAVGEDVTRDGGPVQVLDLDGLLVLPGLVDMHVHLREPGQERKETIATGARAALAGGFTSLACMPNTEPALDDATGIRYVREQAARAGAARVYPIGAISKGRRGEELAAIGEMVAAGAVAVSDDGSPVQDSALMRHALEYCRRWDIPVIEHAEDAQLAVGGVMNEGLVSTRLGLRGIPVEGEVSQVFRDCLLAQLTRGRLHIAHVSAAGSVAVLRWARQQGIRVTAEVTPHHLLLTEVEVSRSRYDANTKVNPPLRSEADRQEVWRALHEGIIDCIASDHAPHMAEEKNVEFDLAPFGVVGLETTLGLVATHLVGPSLGAGERAGAQRLGAGVEPRQMGVESEALGTAQLPSFTWAQVVERLAVQPARILRLPGGAGTLSAGAAADVIVVDPRAEWTVKPEEFYSRGKNTPFAGWPLRGRVEYAWVGGELRFARERGGFLES